MKFQDLTLTLNTNLRGNTKDIYKKKLTYETIFKTIDSEKYFSPSEDNFFYGKIDTNNFFIYPSEDDLKPVYYKNDLVKFPEIVASAVIDLQYFFANSRNILRPRSKFVDAFVADGYKPINQEYVKFLSKFYKVFYSQISYEKNKYITNAKTFMDVFIEICTKYIYSFHVPITRTGFIGSNYFPINCTGLAVDLYKIDTNNDQVKYDEFIKDLNFEFLIETANRFNFLIDKNIPTRLIFNVNSETLYEPNPRDNCDGYLTSGYFYRYDIKSVEDFYNKKYVKSMTGQINSNNSEIDNLKIIFVQMYNTLTIPGQEFLYADVDQNNKVNLFKNNRKGLTLAELNAIFSNEFWLKLLLFLRGKESRQLWNQIEYENFYSKSLVIYKNYGFLSAISFIDFITKNVLELDKEKTLVLERDEAINKIFFLENNFRF